MADARLPHRSPRHPLRRPGPPRKLRRPGDPHRGAARPLGAAALQRRPARGAAPGGEGEGAPPGPAARRVPGARHLQEVERRLDPGGRGAGRRGHHPGPRRGRAPARRRGPAGLRHRHRPRHPVHRREAGEPARAAARREAGARSSAWAAWPARPGWRASPTCCGASRATWGSCSRWSSARSPCSGRTSRWRTRWPRGSSATARRRWCWPAVHVRWTGAPGPRVVATRSAFYPDTEWVMGWDFRDTGFQVVLSAEVPRITRENIGGTSTSSWPRRGSRAPTSRHWIAHTGGPKVLEAFQSALGLPDGALDRSWRSLEEVGNLSSASVLFVLGDLLDVGRAPARETAGCSWPWGPDSAPRWYCSSGEREPGRDRALGLPRAPRSRRRRAGSRALRLDPQRAPAARPRREGDRPAALPGDGGLPRPLPPGAGARGHRLPRAALALGLARGGRRVGRPGAALVGGADAR